MNRQSEVKMDPRQVFDDCEEFERFNENSKILLDKIMNIKTPTAFDDEFATDEELEVLTSELDRMAEGIPQVTSIKNIIARLPAVRVNKINFI